MKVNGQKYYSVVEMWLPLGRKHYSSQNSWEVTAWRVLKKHPEVPRVKVGRVAYYPLDVVTALMEQYRTQWEITRRENAYRMTESRKRLATEAAQQKPQKPQKPQEGEPLDPPPAIEELKRSLAEMHAKVDALLAAFKAAGFDVKDAA